jgi:hypothetical protein
MAVTAESTLDSTMKKYEATGDGGLSSSMQIL